MKTLNNLAIAAACGAMAFALPVTAADKFSVKVGGRVQFDAALVDSDEDLAIENFSGSEFRRVRLFASGAGFDRLDYKVQIDFDQGGEIGFEDVYIRLKAAGGKFWLGNFHQPFGMEELTSSKYTDFMERSMASQAIDLSKVRSVGYSTNTDSVWFMTSVFSQQNDEGVGAENEGVGAAARIIYSPVNTDTNVIHFGGSLATMEDGGYRGVRYRTNYHLMDNRIENRNAAGDLDGPTQYALEFAGAWGPVTLKAEYFGLTADASDAGTQDFDYSGAYVNFLYTLGFNPAKAYSVSKGGVFDRIKSSNVWQFGGRYDFIDSEFDNGGDKVESNALTLGATYIMNPYTRFKADLVFAESELNGADVQDDTVLQFRTQIDF